MNNEPLLTEGFMMQDSRRENNFAVLRLLAAFMVIAGHMGHILATNVPTIFDRQVQTVGVYIFFLIGGYLISMSWLSDPSPLRYGIKRFMRIWPPLAAYVLVAALVAGPLLSNLPVRDYYIHPTTWNYLLNLLLDIRYGLPGVFEQNIYPNAVNGSLWTLPIEALMYVCVPILLAVTKIKKHSSISRYILLCFCIFVCVLNCWQYTNYPDARIVVYDTDWISGLQIVPFYFIGMVCSQFDIKKYCNLQIALVLIMILSCVNMDYIPMQIVLFIALPYIVFSLAFAPSPLFSILGRWAEISYGLYLYGFFIQQIVVYEALSEDLSLSYMQALEISVVFTIIAAYLSYLLVERPTQILTKKILRRLKNN